MAFCTKLGILQNRNVPVTSMLGSLRYMPITRTDDNSLKDVFSTFNGVTDGAMKAYSRGVCVSKGGRFPPYESAGKPPNSVGRGSKDLTMCRVFRKSTCCSPAQTNPAFVAVRNLATYGEGQGKSIEYKAAEEETELGWGIYRVQMPYTSN
ncbi:hypothetical protein F2Q68_00007636 [Brassica cretica]|uniref:Uncharacterized protein n=1 Tax=Brassica cretica TaxID=69181 RepID=A0A8S9L1Z0_BRACR|nr:hypothetical protein F2Q68_00007636 [Brassica cretica]